MRGRRRPGSCSSRGGAHLRPAAQLGHAQAVGQLRQRLQPRARRLLHAARVQEAQQRREDVGVGVGQGQVPRAGRAVGKAAREQAAEVGAARREHRAVARERAAAREHGRIGRGVGLRVEQRRQVARQRAGRRRRRRRRRRGRRHRRGRRRREAQVEQDEGVAGEVVDREVAVGQDGGRHERARQPGQQAAGGTVGAHAPHGALRVVLALRRDHKERARRVDLKDVRLSEHKGCQGRV
jgi:hypothetical protein